jgi:hypothetical protein
LSRPEAGLGNRALVAEGYAAMPSPGVYRLAAISAGYLAGSVADQSALSEEGVRHPNEG